jgi:hypothetical protein
MPRVLPLIATAAILAPLAGHSAILVIDAPRDPLAIAGDDIARIVDGADLASLAAAERAVVEMTGGRVLDYALSGDSRATLTAGEISIVSLSDRATADFNGSFHGSRITLTGNARADVRGGYFLQGGFAISDAATVHVYGSDFSFGQGRLRGFLEDGNPFGQFGERFVGRTDDPLADFRQLMPEGLCVHTGGNEYCGSTLFYSTFSDIQLHGTDRMTVVEGGSARFVRMTGQASLDIRGGSSGFVGMVDDVRVTMSGGTGGPFFVGGRSRLEVSGGVLSNVELFDDSVAEFTARDARFNLGRLEGEWADGTTFGIAVTTPSTFDVRFMPSGMCVIRGADKFCGATLFYESNNAQFLGGTERVAMVDGARLEDVRLFQEAALDVSGGFASFVRLAGSSQLTMTGGHLGVVSLDGNSHMTMTDGQLGSVNVRDDGNAELLGGRIDQLQVGGRSLVTLSDMEGLSFISVAGLDGGHVTLKVLAATLSGDRIVGTWLGGAALDVSLFGVDQGDFATKISVVAVPEPATWLSMVLGLGALVGARRRLRDTEETSLAI